MKKIVSILAIALLVAMLATAAFAAEENVITTDIIVNTVEAAAGDEVILEVCIKNNPNITNGIINVEFDTDALEPNWQHVLVDEDEDLYADTILVAGEDDLLIDGIGNGTRFVFAATKSYKGDGVLFRIYLKVKADAKPGSYEVKVNVEELCKGESDVVANCQSGYVVIPCTEHVWAEEGTVKTPATCTEPGVMEYKCIYCDATKEEAIPAEGHAWGEWAVTTEPSCGVKGEETRTCANCGETETREVAALDHAWGEWAVTTEPKCGVKGEETRTCANCGETETREVAALDHAWGEWTLTTEPKCGVKGEETRVCANCGETETREVAALDHAWGEWTLTTEPSCGVKGEETRVCANCGETETREVAALDHAWGEWTVTTEPTCKDAGVKTRTCANCGEVETEEIPVTEAHVWDEGVKTDATCCEAGKIVYTCTVCGATKEETVAATGEHELVYEAIDDTYHKVICKTSGKELSTEAHTFGDWIDDAENPGWKYQVCEKCQYKLLDEPGETGDNSMIAVAVAAMSMMAIAVVVSKKKEF